MRCCGGGVRSAPGGHAWRGWLGRVGTVVRWGAPVAVLALVPKCPACVAGYVLLLTGVGLSVPGAAAVRWSVVGLCIAALAYLVVRAGLRVVGRRNQGGTATH
jgi:hypothetical protein